MHHPTPEANELDAAESLRPSGEFSIGQSHSIVKDLFQPRPFVYWTDFLASMAVGAFCFVVVRNSFREGLLVDRLCGAWGTDSLAARWSLIALFFAVQCLGFYRAALFTHELIHLRPGSFRGFRLVWNLLCGVPFLMPSFLYHTHVHHHRRKHYGTKDDGEYLPLAAGPARAILVYLAQSFIIPLLAVVRFGLLTPLAWLSPPFRRLVRRRASSLVIDPSFVRPPPTASQLQVWRLQEAACLVVVWGAGGLLALRLLPPTWLLHAYATGACIIMLNAVRTLGAHRYRHTGEELTFGEQLLDSLNYPRWPMLSELWAPVGLRFHALHHLFPSLPYHNLARAHRRLMRSLPADSPYRQTEADGLLNTLRELWASARQASHDPRGKMGRKKSPTSCRAPSQSATPV